MTEIQARTSAGSKKGKACAAGIELSARVLRHDWPGVKSVVPHGGTAGGFSGLRIAAAAAQK